jgi:prepilin peptidase CpaA
VIASSTILDVTALVVVTIGAVWDMRTTKIPNKLTFPAALVGVIMQTVFSGVAGLVSGVAGWLTGVALGVVPMLIVQALKILPTAKKKMGFGDVKLIAALGTFLGPLEVAFVFFYFSLLFGLLHVVRLVTDIPWGQISLLVNLSRTGQTEEMAKIIKAKSVKKPIPIGPVIAAGTVLAIVLEKQTRAYFGIH